LMALGSSAPEILLSVIEILTSKPTPCFSGSLGPSTIVGSAAFNMLVILGICVICIPKKDLENPEDDETGVRKIADTNVFAITGVSSIFAYLWLLIILMAITPNIVEWWEALLTFLFFPVLVILAWAADKGIFSNRSSVAPATSIVGTKESGENMTFFKPSEVKNLLKADGHRDILKQDPAELAREAYFKSKPKTRADRRIEATRALTGSRPQHELLAEDNAISLRAWVGFQCCDYCVPEMDEVVTLVVDRSGCSSYEFSCQYRTVEGTAAAPNFESQTGEIKFAAGQTTQTFQIAGAMDMAVQLFEISDSHCEMCDPAHGFTHDWSIANVVVGDNASPAVVSMAETVDQHDEGHTASYKCFESDGRVVVRLVRSGSCAMESTCEFATKSGTATGDRDYKEKQGTVTFAAGQASQSVDVEIIDDDQYEDDEDFTLTISDPQNCSIGGLKTAIITIVNDDEMTETIERVAKLFALNLDKYKQGGASWKAQFVDAVQVPDGAGDKILHFLSLPWKVSFATCPPPALLGGWLCFGTSLGMIGVVTALIGDLAGHFGCSVGMKDEVTAITFVALGTSLPDTFASKAAAIGDKTADASIGNVTGSNSVNVFLGLGLPWLIASIYWSFIVVDDQLRYSEWTDYLYGRSGLELADIDAIIEECGTATPCFVVPAGSLGFSVSVFSACGVVCLGSLVLRRSLYGYELGGKMKYPFGIFFIALWLLYVGLSTWKSYS